jgi:hypothetical protein
MRDSSTMPAKRFSTARTPYSISLDTRASNTFLADISGTSSTSLRSNFLEKTPAISSLLEKGMPI